MICKILNILFYTACFISPTNAQLRIGNAHAEINFREGPGSNYSVLHSITNSNLLVILPREPQNGFIEVFDVETSLRGYVYESLIQITDTLFFQEQNFFEKSGETANGDVEIVLINRTDLSLFIWINNNSYNLFPYEKKTLIFENEDITYFSSASGLFPVFGHEILKKGNAYIWNFKL